MTKEQRSQSNKAYRLLKKAKSKLGVYRLTSYEAKREDQAIKALNKLIKEFGKETGLDIWDNNSDYYNTKANWIKNQWVIDKALNQKILNAADIYIIESAHSVGVLDDESVIKALKRFDYSLWDKIKSLFNF